MHVAADEKTRGRLASAVENPLPLAAARSGRGSVCREHPNCRSYLTRSEVPRDTCRAWRAHFQAADDPVIVAGRTRCSGNALPTPRGFGRVSLSAEPDAPASRERGTGSQRNACPSERGCRLSGSAGSFAVRIQVICHHVDREYEQVVVRIARIDYRYIIKKGPGAFDPGCERKGLRKEVIACSVICTCAPPV